MSRHALLRSRFSINPNTSNVVYIFKYINIATSLCSTVLSSPFRPAPIFRLRSDLRAPHTSLKFHSKSTHNPLNSPTDNPVSALHNRSFRCTDSMFICYQYDLLLPISQHVYSSNPASQKDMTIKRKKLNAVAA